MESVKLVIFDMDGTLINSEEIYARGWLEGLAKYGFKVSEEFVKGMSGNSVEINNRIIKNIVKSDELVQKVRKYRENLFEQCIEKEKIEAIPGARDILESLCKSQRYTIGLATLSRRERATKVLQQANLIQYFDLLKFGDDVKRQKPFPDVYLDTMSECKIEPQKTLIFEDSLNGFKAAYASKARVVLVNSLDIRPSESKKDSMFYQSYRCFMNDHYYL
ncbi:HAD family hydrolase [Dolosicoccus paucivorans]|uniref:HAD family hydrolase n=1 Tax=Dolosicoccus paucivorans TaxID=84521 RepID=UPI00088497F4|nr:HAD family phosphatase [Dolosicoccus paucivorans]SDI68377.1 haloacid dehalogenase superfamily, subfamily IA, variant 3 with third motif having DD or ED [Dolosicoccus paucivorans]